MRTVAIKGLIHRKLRTVLTALAIVFGVALITGSYVLTDTIERAFTSIFQTSYSTTDLVVSGRPVVEFSAGGAPTVAESLVPQVRDLPGVDDAAGVIFDLTGESNQAKILDDDGTVISNGSPTFGAGVDPDRPELSPLTLADGRWARGKGEVVVDVATARAHGFALGETVRVSGDGPVRSFTVTGTARFGDVDSLGGATFAVFDTPTAKTVLGKDGYDAILVTAADTAQATASISPLLGSGLQIETGAARAERDGESVGEFMSFLRYALLAFAGIALFVGAFVIFNTMSITVAQRTRELATMRTLGASRRQVRRSVVFESFVVGLVASAVGFVAGLGLVQGLIRLFAALELELPTTSQVIETRTVIVSLVAGTLIALAAGIVPAIRATRVAPISAVREGVDSGAPASARRPAAVAAVTGGLSALALAYGLLSDGGSAGTRVLAAVAGALGIFVAVAMTMRLLVRPLTAVLGWPSARLGGTAGALARSNASRSPARTAATAGALMIGLTLVTVVALLGTSLKQANRDAVSGQIAAAHVVSANQSWEYLPRAAGESLRGAGTVVSAVRLDRAKVDGLETDVTGVDPQTIGRVYDFEWTEGSDAAVAALGSGGAIVARTFAEDQYLRVGGDVDIVTSSGASVRRTVVGIYDPPRFDPLLKSVIVSQETFDSAFAGSSDSFILVDGAASAAALQARLGEFPDATVRTREQFVDNRAGEIDGLLNLLYVLLALSVVISIFGMVNTLVLSVVERTREVGMLRAIGLTRRQVRRMVRHESIIVALIGAALALPLGIGLTALIVRPLGTYGVELMIPTGTLALFAGVAVLVGLIAAVAPARRAARLRPVEALSYE